MKQWMGRTRFGDATLMGIDAIRDIHEGEILGAVGWRFPTPLRKGLSGCC